MTICTRCGAPFGCAMADGSPEPCWCTRLPPAVPVPDGAAGCWCPACLEQHIAARQAQQAEVPPEPLN
ncbi:cysteine-rich CWC family protein [Massilia terrae]|uniref:Cysteine-rich CWC family protein n=1 Tax=Massilia terrae TaxID=1811224 RepID=A0ABT2D4I1_9BURK|nr:cysteine-rich CWC family protein [Massilia terrae]MCS0661149.1 cysteine-rich CWC family protein [Massilia terrae]